jgi:hypothetical protein
MQLPIISCSRKITVVLVFRDNDVVNIVVWLTQNRICSLARVLMFYVANRSQYGATDCKSINQKNSRDNGGTTLKLTPAFRVSRITTAGERYLGVAEVDKTLPVPSWSTTRAMAVLRRPVAVIRCAANPPGSRCLTYFRRAMPDSWSSASSSSTANTSSAGSSAGSAAEARSARRRQGAEVGWRRKRGAGWGLEVEVEGRERWESAAARVETESAMLARGLVRVSGALWIGRAAPRWIS